MNRISDYIYWGTVVVGVYAIVYKLAEIVDALNAILGVWV